MPINAVTKKYIIYILEEIFFQFDVLTFRKKLEQNLKADSRQAQRQNNNYHKTANFRTVNKNYMSQENLTSPAFNRGRIRWRALSSRKHTINHSL